MKSVFGITLAVLVSALIVANFQQCEAASTLWKGFACAKEYIVNTIRDGVISRSTLAQHYNETMNKVGARYEAALLSGDLEGKDDQERENFLYKLMVEEMNKLKKHIDSGAIKEENADADVAKPLDGCVDPDAMVQNWNADTDFLKEDDTKLLVELENLEREEDEMGYGLSDEARDKLKSRTKQVLLDLIQNEVRQLGLAVISAYFSGGSVVPALLSVAGPLKFKLADFFMNIFVDFASYALGRQIEINPAPSEVPVAA